MANWKSLSLTILCALSLIISGCGEDPQETPPSVTQQQEETVVEAPASKQALLEGWGAHIESRPAEWVSAHNPMTLSFTHPVIGEHTTNTPVEGLLAIEPKIAFRSYFKDDRTIQIELLEPLNRDATYTVTVFSQLLDGIDKKLAPYQFNVKPFKQDFSLQINGLEINTASNEHTITGRITLNDTEHAEQVKKILSASQNNIEKPILWDQTSSTEYLFTINNINRLDAASTVSLKWDGQPIGLNKKGNKTITIPALNSFDITGIISHQSGDQYIEINFSETLERNQSLRGLIQLNDIEPRNIRIDGNKLRVYPKSKLSGDVTVKIAPGIKSTKGNRTDIEYEQALTFLSEKPGVRFHGKEYIIPRDGNMSVTIEAVNVDSVQITAYRTPIKNLGQFLQSSNLTNTYLYNQTSAVHWRKTYALPEIPKDKWQKFDLDLGPIVEEFGNDILALEIRINRSNIILDCGVERPQHDDTPPINQQWPTEQANEQPDWVYRYYESQGYGSWSDRDNPCKDYFYNYHRNTSYALRYFSASNLGLIAKMGVDHKMHVVVTDINSAQPLNEVDITAYNYQHQPVAKAKTNNQGIATFTPVSAPYYLIAKTQDDLSFLRLNRHEAISTNTFDVGGSKTTSGLKGFFYGERGVWRPGDEIFLTFIAQDRTGNFPEGYPLTLDFFDPKGVKRESITQANPVNGFYHFKLATDVSAPTGNWRAVIRYGTQYFDKTVPVEAIVPNRLKIELDFPRDVLTPDDRNTQIGIFSQWLHGAPANRLKADIKMVMRAVKTSIAGYDQFIFDDPSRTLNSQSITVFDGTLDSNGKANFSFSATPYNAPGQVQLNYTTRVFEPSGNFSTQYMSRQYIPYAELVGINVPKGNGWNDSISRDEKHQINFISLDPEGNRQANSKLNFTIYQIGWRWWWDYSNDNLNNYINNSHTYRVVNTDLTTDEHGQATYELDGQQFDWGRYLLRVCDTESKHCSGKIVYLGWSYNNLANPSGDTQLMVSMDKKSYTVGDTAYLTIPQVLPNTDNVRYLLSLESGTRILSSRWVEGEIKDNKIAIPITEDMAPNIYAHVTLIQGYENKDNDSPVRLYGLTPIMVNNPATGLSPVITTADTVRPESTMSIKVSEQQGKAMTYTLALVDEGLLGITNYRTPDPRNAFYKREALGVLTWDMYNLLSRSNAQALNSLITLGGSDSADDEKGGKKKRRFPPVVKFIGPFELKPGQTAEHNITLPEYMGAVRVMVVAGDAQNKSPAYGKAETTVKVTQPLTLLATLPRVLGPNEKFSLPVSIFANDESIKEVQISVTANDLFKFSSDIPVVSFKKPGDQIINLDFETINSIGTGEVTITATSGNETASQTIYIPVRSANEPQIIANSMVIPAGETHTLELTPNGMLNTNHTYLEVSRLPDINIDQRLEYLIGYPHGCLEQTTSKLFPQIFLTSLVSLTDSQKKDIDRFVKAGIDKLKTFQQADGNFSYWPNGSYYNSWSNSYVGHFLLEAKRLGYVVPGDMTEKWIKAQQNNTNNYSRTGYESSNAYALYTLALAGQPNFNAMNRLKERLSTYRNTLDQHNYRLARWLLAAAYAKSGVTDAANELLQAGANTVSPYDWAGYTYGSDMRDLAILMMTYSELNNDTAAWETATEIGQLFKEGHWYSTHSTAWALTALSHYFSSKTAEEQPLSYSVNGGAWESTTIASPIFKQTLQQSADPVTVEFRNESSDSLYVLLGNKGIPANTEEKATESHVSFNVRYTDMKGRTIDITRLKQGTDFKAYVTVEALDYHSHLENLALNMTMPSGWQISNSRMEGKELPKGIEYQDIRDDRVLSYFTLGRYYWYHRYDQRTITVEVTLNASFKGRFYLPGWHVEGMYDNKVKANTVGQWIEVYEDQPETP